MLGLQQPQVDLLGLLQVPAPCFKGPTDQRARAAQEPFLVDQIQLLEAQVEAQVEGFQFLQRLDLLAAREERSLELGLLAALHQGEQLGAMVDLLQVSQ